MALFDSKTALNHAIRYLADAAQKRAAGGWIPPKEQERQQRDAMRQEQQQARQAEKQQKEAARAEEKQQKLLSKQYPTHYMPNVGRQVMMAGGVPDEQPQRQLSPMGFYSAAAERAQTLQPSGDAVQMVNALKNTQGIKTEELQNAGLIDQSGNVHPDWAGRGKVTRDELMSHLQGQMPQVEETVLGGYQPFDSKKLTQLENEYAQLKQHPIDDPSFGEDKYNEMIRLMNIRDQSSADSLYKAAEEAMLIAQRSQRRGNMADAEKMFREHELLNTRAEKLELQGQGLENPTKYSQYTLPGGENYREVLLKLPKQKSVSPEMQYKNGDDIRAKINEFSNAGFSPEAVQEAASFVDQFGSVKDGLRKQDALIARGWGYTPQQKEAGEVLRGILSGYQKQNIEAMRKAEQSNFKSQHWDDPNVLAHIRMSDRTGPNGEKILHVEELQSDWGQKGKKEGFVDQNRITPEEEQEYFNLQNIDRKDRTEAQQNRLNELLAKEEGQHGTVPSAPYVTSTEGWTDLALKRVLKEAAEGGYDKVVWTPGAEQAKRYDLSKQISKLTYLAPDSKFGDKFGTNLRAYDHQGNVVINKTVPPKELENYVGKEVAKKLIDQEADRFGKKELSGLDLSVGGEGMKGYYDTIVPKRLQNLAKKHDKNARVGYHNISDKYHVATPNGQNITAEPVDSEEHASDLIRTLGRNNPLDLSVKKVAFQMPGLEITPAMRESILRGQSAYADGGEVDREGLAGGGNPGDIAGGGYGTGNIGGGSSISSGGSMAEARAADRESVSGYSGSSGGGGGGRDYSPSISFGGSDNDKEPGLGFGGAEVMSPLRGISNGVPMFAPARSQEQMLRALGVEGEVDRSGLPTALRPGGNIGATLAKEAITPDLTTANSPLASGIPAYNREALDAMSDSMRSGQAALRDASVARVAGSPPPAEINIPNAGDLYGATSAPLAVNQLPSGMFGQPEFGTTKFGQEPMQSGFPSAKTQGPALEDVMGTRPQGEYLLSQMDISQKPIPKTYSVNPQEIAAQVRAKEPLAAFVSNDYILNEMRKQMPPDIQYENGQVSGFDVKNPETLANLERYGIAPSSFKPVMQTSASTNWGAPAQEPYRSVAESSAAPQSFDSMYPVAQAAAQPQAASQQAASAEPRIGMPQLSQQPLQTSAAQSPMTIRQNFEKAFSEARNQGLQVFTWTNPVTGQSATYTTALARKAGGRIPSLKEPDQWIAETEKPRLVSKTTKPRKPSKVSGAAIVDRALMLSSRKS